MSYDSTHDTLNHCGRVNALLHICMLELSERARAHDASKYEEPEKSAFDRATPLLQTVEYGTPEYNAVKAQLGEALQHHYAHNSHHPEHYPNGMEGMSLLDLLEMLCDWKAAGERMQNGSLEASIRINRERFGDSPLLTVLENTRKELGW